MLAEEVDEPAAVEEESAVTAELVDEAETEVGTLEEEEEPVTSDPAELELEMLPSPASEELDTPRRLSPANELVVLPAEELVVTLATIEKGDPDDNVDEAGEPETELVDEPNPFSLLDPDPTELVDEPGDPATLLGDPPSLVEEPKDPIVLLGDPIELVDEPGDPATPLGDPPSLVEEPKDPVVLLGDPTELIEDPGERTTVLGAESAKVAELPPELAAALGTLPARAREPELTAPALGTLPVQDPKST
jgi:hypothetical protein